MGGGGIGGLVDQLAPERAIIEAHLPRADGGAQNVTDPLRQMRSAREGFPVVASIPFMAKSHAPATRGGEAGRVEGHYLLVGSGWLSPLEPTDRHIPSTKSVNKSRSVRFDAGEQGNRKEIPQGGYGEYRPWLR
jgi:hypothetical protein